MIPKSRSLFGMKKVLIENWFKLAVVGLLSCNLYYLKDLQVEKIQEPEPTQESEKIQEPEPTQEPEKTLEEEKIISVEISVSYDSSKCSEEYPLFVTIKNIGDRTVRSVFYNIAGYRKGYSTNVLETLYGRRYSSDKILKSGESYTQCVKIFLQTQYASIDPKTLEYNAYSVSPYQ